MRQSRQSQPVGSSNEIHALQKNEDNPHRKNDNEDCSSTSSKPHGSPQENNLAHEFDANGHKSSDDEAGVSSGASGNPKNDH
ncbi:hypothetical protein IL306_011890 [Fusarium sp. DS 682]|nr:hypothetical protein IL306_011890 [Fusarium sp. DS 682]